MLTTTRWPLPWSTARPWRPFSPLVQTLTRLTPITTCLWIETTSRPTNWLRGETLTNWRRTVDWKIWLVKILTKYPWLPMWMEWSELSVAVSCSRSSRHSQVRTLCITSAYRTKLRRSLSMTDNHLPLGVAYCLRMMTPDSNMPGTST